jgi:hypothetical protein
MISLTNGPWRVELFDPRADGAALGSRFVHGGYIADVFREQRRISAAPKPQWEPYAGLGFPEAFEESLGLSRAVEGEEFLRIGAGRMRKTSRESPQSKGPLSGTLNWTVHLPNPSTAIMETADGAVIDGKTFSYQLRRTVRVGVDEIASETWLKVRCTNAHPLAWYPHPYFLHSSGEQSAFKLPKNAHLTPIIKTAEDGLLRFPPAGGTAAVTAVWGNRDPLAVSLDTTYGAGRVQIETSYPLDKCVALTTPNAACIKPYWSRHWHDGEDATWAVTYRWLGD